jgi:hypothetical protein
MKLKKPRQKEVPPQTPTYEEVEELAAELHPDRLSDLRFLDHREIEVVESRPDDHIPS